MSLRFLPVNVDLSLLNTGDKKTGRAVGELQPFLSRRPEFVRFRRVATRDNFCNGIAAKTETYERPVVV